MSERHVMPNGGPDGGWKIVNPDPDGSASGGAIRVATQADAISHAVECLPSGGSVVIHGRDGRVRDRRTIPAPRRA